MNKKELDKLEEREPFLEACLKYMNSNPTPFDVPGHKMGRLTNDLVKFAGKECAYWFR